VTPRVKKGVSPPNTDGNGMPTPDRHKDRWIVRASLAGLVGVLCFLVAFSVVTRHAVAVKSAGADRATRLSATYQDARHWVGEQKSVERQYRIEGSSAVLAAHRQAERRLIAELDHVLELDNSPPTRATVARLMRLQAGYHGASQALFSAVDENDPERVVWLDHSAVDPVFGVLADVVYRQAAATSASALADSAALRGDEVRANRTIATAVLLALLLVGFFGAVVVRYGRRLDAAEVERLSEMAITDPLTGLRNHRAFHEDVARELQRAGRTGVPLALVLLDVDGLKAVNDTQGHQAGDERLQALAEAIRVTGRGSDVAYRVGGDEFAVILPDARTWGALEFAQRLRAATQAGTDAGGSFTATAGISEALTLRSKDELVREADLALIGAKRIHQDVLIYGPDLAPAADRGAEGDVHHTRTLASALARAVDAKDSYTRSHCQTVSQLCGLIGAELGFDSAGLTRLRLAGLLHDVGKIGVPDAILNKPAKLTEDEYEQMKRHSLLGYDIVEAADMAVEARWVRHHHERFDGGGYPDGLAGEEIPLESRVILVADAFEAMTSDRPYRQAPGQSFAIVELGRNAGTQFDPAVVEALTCVLARAGEIGHVPAPSAATA
jgi:diguanylate cyclase (GGDEF)-like protein